MRLWVGVGLLALAASVVADPRDFSIDIRPVFDSQQLWGTAPVAVEIENRGPNASGNLFVGDPGSQTRYPIELPTGAKKRIVAYPSFNLYGTTPEFVLDTDQGRMPIPYMPKGDQSYGNMAIVAMVSDTSGDLAFLRTFGENKGARPNAMYGDAYCKPEFAPDRPAGYSGITSVVLGQGAERLSDGSVAALKSFALTGGTLLFMGGASAAVLVDPRWAGILPIRDVRTTTIRQSKLLSSIGGTRWSEELTVAAGRPIPSAKVQTEGSIPLLAQRGFGLGRVVVYAFNPFEDPMVRWSGRRSMFMRDLRDVDYLRTAQFLGQFSGSSQDYYSYQWSGGAYSGSSYPTGGQNSGDPFSVRLPPATKVFSILLAFFLVVVPINFFVLRKLGKGELAWVTAPIISTAFSLVFLSQAGELYSSSLSTATSGVLIVQHGEPQAMFVGNTQMFFPNGGSYDLKMKNVDQLGMGANEYGYVDSETQRSRFDPVDTGSILIPDLRATNLAFEEIAYRQRFSAPSAFQIRSTRLAGDQIRLTVRNLTGSTLKNAALVVRGGRYPLNALEPGAEQSLVPPTARRIVAQGDPLDGMTRNQNIVVVVADLDSIRPGPQIGVQVASRTRLRLVYVAPIDIEESPK